MADTSVSYQCPNCGAPLQFKPKDKTVAALQLYVQFDVDHRPSMPRKKRGLPKLMRPARSVGRRKRQARIGATTKRLILNLHVFVVWRRNRLR